MMRPMWEGSLGISILNGALGDYLERTGNGLATPMGWAGAAPAGERAVVFVYGLMCTEAIWRMPDGGDYGALLARDLGLAPGYVRYNTGLPVRENGARLAALLDELRGPRELILVGYSMGGLVLRHALDTGRPFAGRVRRCVYLGTPHGGAPLERLGRGLVRLLRRIDEPTVQLAGRLGELRSAGIRDLGEALGGPLPPGIEHHLIAGGRDGMVPVGSATDGLPPERVRIFDDLGHLDLPRDPRVYEQIRTWCEAA